ncbi:exopolysaccharide biosynthesis polyprenyl glycosylphosphotransferase [Methylobacillus sp. MM3]|uniref:TIGR03013 family XrtA/PEP-CTERM system glycosyltransferase n=1 Tax=Methylobacillus sp. MM3 TaxID=1848039 RepID=UPI0007DE67A1|nr:TIGR03013 family XrtA/PEP-CTERM system glycosyltransferase [Methylobacillus sp. MM3]OAJ69536.1 exopolysaccharide biosynthesis polyprenyl glycosylphosphotransferase [Methylobacillus sp. MM3]
MYKSFHHYVAVTGTMLLVTEAVIMMAAVYLGVSIRFFELFFSPPYVVAEPLINIFPYASAFALVMLLSMAAVGMYQLGYREDFRKTLLRLMRAMAFGLGFIVLIFYWVPETYVGRGILGNVMLITATGIFLTRLIFYRWSNAHLQKNRIMVLGTGRLAKECSILVEKNPTFDKFQIVGFIPMPNEVCQVSPAMVLSADGSPLMSMVSKYRINEIVVAVRNRRSEHFSIQELLKCKLHGVRVSDTETFFEREMGQVLMDSLQPGWLVFNDGFDQSKLRISIKRTFDLLASLALLIVTLPIMLITALCIFLEDRKSIVYRQERVGKDGQHFMILKFRSMRNDAEEKGKPQWACENDPRTTRVGRIIRQLRIDELPQILNVLKGEMSFVGPRPERPYFVEQLSAKLPYYHVRHSIKPGITGWAQVRYRYGASVEDAIQKLQYDLFYVKNNSLFLDIIILIDTIRVVIFGKGGR